ncbi:phosphoserine phosphatase SerB [Sneathiella chinensis]|uniref:Phosphoserine phosphatase n=1 Tax=Sneathiella chinensis TaxID=349750 RepID=A0ABQ5TYT6_9PROT|nr:phosphoserine phosphatase SerB [Sneathiella chinensis]GLQ05147.1 phosphoserine phosphatase SerB [Sneathiella chinensis]
MKNHVATVVTHPDKSDLTSSLQDQLASQLAAEGARNMTFRWLNEGVAFDCFFDAEGMDAAESILAPLKGDYDCTVQPNENRRKRLLVSDMDSTMIDMESLDVMADALGVGAAVRALTEQSMQGTLNFEQSLRARVSLLAGKPAAALDDLVGRISYLPGAKTLIQTMRKYGAYTALISGGFTFTTEVVAKALGFHEHHANPLPIKEDKILGTLGPEILGPASKADLLTRLCRQRGLTPLDAAAVGDGANDIPMLQTAGLGVAYHGQPIVVEQTPRHINHADLTALLYFQGYHHSEFTDSEDG